MVSTDVLVVVIVSVVDVGMLYPWIAVPWWLCQLRMKPST
jgi:hypothetical protein